MTPLPVVPVEEVIKHLQDVMEFVSPGVAEVTIFCEWLFFSACRRLSRLSYSWPI